MRESWTDARLDDFAGNTDRRFDEVDRRFDEVDRRFDEVDRRFDEIDRRFEQVDRRFDKVDKRFDKVDRRFEVLEHRMETGFREVNVRFDALQRTLLQLGGGMLVALVGLIATQL